MQEECLRAGEKDLAEENKPIRSSLYEIEDRAGKSYVATRRDENEKYFEQYSSREFPRKTAFSPQARSYNHLLWLGRNMLGIVIRISINRKIIIKGRKYKI